MPYLDADGDPTDPTTPDTEFSLDAAAFGDTAEEVTTISGSNGVGHITLTGAETNGNALALAFKVASGPKATLMFLYPRDLVVFESGTAQAGAAGSITLASGATAIPIDGCFVRTTGGTGGGGTGGANNQVRRITAYNTSTKVATIAPNWETNPSSDTTYDVLLPDGVTKAQIQTLNPTTAGRTLDVTATGAAGIDWGNVENPTTALNLSATNIDVDQVVASVSGAVGSVTGAVGSVTGNVGGNVTGSVGSVATGGIAAASFAAGAIDATAIAANAIGASELAADAVAEIADQVWEEAIADHSGTVGSTAEQLAAAGAAGDPWATALPGAYGAGTAGKIVGDNVNATISSRATQTSVDTIDDFVDTEVAAILAAVDTEVAAIKAKTDSLTFTTANQVDCNVFTMQNNTITTAAIAGNAIGTAEVNTAVDARIAGTVWDIVLASHLTAGSTGEALDTAQSGGGGGGSDPWETALPGAYAVGTAGQIVGNLDHSSRTLVRGTISSGSTSTSLNTSSITPTTIDEDQWVGRVLIFEKDTTTTGLRGQATEITSNTAGGVLTVTALTQAPVSGDTFSIV